MAAALPRSGRKSNKAVQVLVIVAVMAVVALVVSNLNLVSGSLVKSDREESASLLREETAGCARVTCLDSRGRGLAPAPFRVPWSASTACAFGE